MNKELRHIAIVSRSQELYAHLRGFWPENEVELSVFPSGRTALEGIMHSVHDLVLTEMQLGDFTGAELIQSIKQENVYRKIPAVLCLGLEDVNRLPELVKSNFDDFVVLPGSDLEFKTRLELAVTRFSRVLDTNPLTNLPGNTSIIKFVQTCIDEQQDFAMLYCDLDFFKSFNDKYGFMRGDEVLMMTARIILNVGRQVAPEHYFVGHVGGDDFVLVLPSAVAEDACQKIIASFDSIVPEFYDADDRSRRCIVAKDRQGVMRTFPIMAISIAVLTNHNRKLLHVGQASQIATNLKKKAKENPKSSYIIDRRMHDENARI